MGMSDGYGPSDRGDAIATIHAALDGGVTPLDTADFYGSGHNEMLIAEALADRPRDSYQLSVKYGSARDPAGGWGATDGRPDVIRNYLAYSLRRLRVDHIDIYRLDGSVPIEDTMGVLADCVQKGWIGHVGLSEFGPDTIRRAAAVHPVADVQLEYSLFSRGIEDRILPTCRELGIAVTAYGVLSRGLLSDSTPKGASDFRTIAPRFQGDNLAANLKLVERLKSVALKMGSTTTQVAMWVLAQGEDIVPLTGARRPGHLSETFAALNLKMAAPELAAIEAAVPRDAVQGGRYPDAFLARLDSER
jgi:pyridoxine 4-dehydrogenase